MNRILRNSPTTLILLLLAALVIGVFWQVGGHSFINLDDNGYIYENSQVRGGLTCEGVAWAFSSTEMANWHPLTWISHMADVELFGLDAGWHHRVNALFHLLNTLLLFLVLNRMTESPWRSGFVAALFAVHPLHVESVAWVAERKDVLSTLFWILTMWAYLRYTRRPCVARYLLVAAMLAIGLMCKPMLVTLPFVLLLLDWWPLGRHMRSDASPTAELPWSMNRVMILFLEKIPFMALSAISCVITYISQEKGEAVIRLEAIPIGERLGNALVSYAGYIGNMLCPVSLAVFYPHLGRHLPILNVVGAAILLIAITVLAIRMLRLRPYLAVGWFWYLGTLVPVIGLVQVGTQAMADRYTYVPLIGLFIMIAWGAADSVPKTGFRRNAVVASGAAIIVVLACLAWVQANHWRDSVSLFRHALDVTKDNGRAEYNLGEALGSQGDLEQAAIHYREAIRINPKAATAHNNLANILAETGHAEEAIAHFKEAIRIVPDYAQAHNNLGVTLYKQKMNDEAAREYLEALRIEPDYADAHFNMGLLLEKTGKLEDALFHYRDAVRLSPGDPSAARRLQEAETRLKMN